MSKVNWNLVKKAWDLRNEWKLVEAELLAETDENGHLVNLLIEGKNYPESRAFGEALAELTDIEMSIIVELGMRGEKAYFWDRVMNA